MKRFLKFPKSQAQDMAWQFLLGKLEQAESEKQGLKPAQVAKLRRDVAEFVEGLKLPRAARKAKKPTASASDPTTWLPASYAEAQDYWAAGGKTRELSGRSSVQLLKAALRRRWPNVKFSTATNQYSSTKIRFEWTPSVTWTEVEQIAKCFEGEALTGLDGTGWCYRWAPTATGRELVHHGLGMISLAPCDRDGWDVDRHYKRFRSKNYYQFNN